MAVEHIHHFNMHAEKKYFLGSEYRNNYTIIGLNGNIVAHSPSAVAALISTAAREYYIDPQIHIFQHSTRLLESPTAKRTPGEDIKYKASVKKLAELHLGEPFLSVLATHQRLTPSSFHSHGTLNTELMQQACNQAVRFQKSVINDHLGEEEKEFLGEDSFTPKFLLAPYFYLSRSNFAEWLNINQEFYQITKDSYPDDSIFYSLVVSKDVVESYGQQIAQSLDEIKPDGIMLWIDDHKEEELTPSQLRSYVKFLKGIRSSSEHILNSHAGFFSTLLCHEEVRLLDGVGHAMNYGEHRAVVPVGGGIPQAYFYLKKNHIRNKYADAYSLLISNNWLTGQEEYHSNVCTCPQCEDLLQSSGGNAIDAFVAYGETGEPSTIRRRNGTVVRISYPTGEAKAKSVRHYVANKCSEIDSIVSRSYSDLLAALKSDYLQMEPVSDSNSIQHLDIWHEVLSDSDLFT